MNRFLVASCVLLLLVTSLSVLASPMPRQGPQIVYSQSKAGPDLIGWVRAETGQMLSWFVGGAVATDKYLVMNDLLCSPDHVATNGFCWSLVSGGPGGAG